MIVFNYLINPNLFLNSINGEFNSQIPLVQNNNEKKNIVTDGTLQYSKKLSLLLLTFLSTYV